MKARETGWRRRGRRSVWRWLRARQWMAGGVFIVLAMGLGLVGFRDYFLALGRPRSFPDLFYLTLQLFVLESGSIPGPMGWELETARLLAPLISAWAAVQALAALFRDQVSLLRARFFRNHAVICGLGRKGALLARNFRGLGFRVLAIERDPGNDAVSQMREEGIPVLIGDATDPGWLRKAGLNRARTLLAVCGGDGVNSEIALRAGEVLQGEPGRAVTALVHIVHPDLCDRLREKEMKAGEDPRLRLEYFNIFDSGARAWLRKNPLPLAAGDPPRLLIVGLGHLGERLTVQAADDWRLRCRRSDKLRVTVVDRQATSRIGALQLRFPRTGAACELTALDLDVESPGFQRPGFLLDEAGNSRFSAVFVCFDQEPLALTVALDLRRRLGGRRVSLSVRLESEAGLADLLGGAEAGETAGLRAFGLLDRTLNPELVLSGTHELLARAIHEEYLENRRREAAAPVGDPSLVSWEELPEPLRESNRRQADHIGSKLRAAGCDIAPLRDPEAESFAFRKEEVERLAEMEHERWRQERLRQGWRFAPGPKDGARQKSPHLVPYAELPGEIRELDRQTVRKLPLFLARAGFQIRRGG